MTRTLPVSRHRTPRASRWPLSRILSILIATAGVSALLYPTAATWFSDRTHATEVSGYADSVESVRPAERERLLDAAREFNSALPDGPLRDPFTLTGEGQTSAIGSGADAYEDILGLDSGGVMGHLDIPSIDVHLPVFHDTDADTLAKGVGHLFGTAFPVGGDSTHSVLTAHSGFVAATLFDHLKDMNVGDEFSVTVLDETIYYRVDQIRKVLPSETDELRSVAGKDYLTLLTCTPTGANTHRLLVRGERIDAPATDDAARRALPSMSTDPGFPWWSAGILGTFAGSVLVTRPRSESTWRKRTVRHKP